MGKGKKRKNPGVGVDFRKVKHKVGKKLPKAQNETRTDFQARSINLPNQSITQDKAGAAVSERNLTLKELVCQLGHHNTSSRRDALVGLQQLLASHPLEARRHTALLLEALAPRLSDGEGSVRSALLTTLRCAVLPALGPSALSPFMPLLMAHVSAALTNLSADVRFDALAVLQAVTQAAPQLMGQQQQLGAALAHYAGLLSRANRGKSVKSQALTGLLKVVASLDRFLTAALAGADSGNTAAAAAAAAAGGVAGPESGSSQGDVPLLQGCRSAAAPAAGSQLPAACTLLQLYCPGFGVGDQGNSSSKGSKKGSSKQQQQQQGFGGGGSESAAAAGGASTLDGSGSSSKPLQQQVLGLLEVLFDVWSEAAPGSLSTAPEAESAQVLVHILTATQLILTHFGPSNSPAADPAAAEGGGAGSSVLSPFNSSASSSGEALCPGFNTRRNQAAWQQQAAGIVLPKLTKVFPVAPAATRGLPVALTDLLQRFNLLGMQLCAAFMAAGVAWPAQQKQQKQQQQRQQVAGFGGGDGTAGGQQEWQQRLLEFMAGVLAAGNCLPHLDNAAADPAPPGSSKPKKQQQQQAAVAGAAAPANSSLSSSSTLVAVLQSLQLLLPQLVGPPRQHILAAVGQLSAAAAAGAGALVSGAQHSSSSDSALRSLSPAAAAAAGSNAVRSACLRLQLQLMLQHLWRGVAAPAEEADIAAWLAAAPKLLYQLGTSKPKISLLLLQLLFEAARLSLPGSVIQQQLQELQPQLAALLVTQMPPPAAAAAAKSAKQQQTGGEGSGPTAAAAAGGGGNSQAVRLVVGPLAELPPACQALAFDTLAHLPQLTPPLLKAVALCCRITAYPDAAVLRLLDGLLSSASCSMPPDVYASFLATLLSPGPVGGYVDRGSSSSSRGWQVQAGFWRHQQVVDAACRWLHCYGPLPDLLPLLVAPLLQQHQQQVAAAAGKQQVCCLTYSLAALAALGASCWVPSSSTAAAAAAAAASEGEVAAASMPAALLEVLPGVLGQHCVSRAGSCADAFASQAAVEQCLQQLVLPLACALPSSALLLPLMTHLVQLVQAPQQQQGVLRVVVHVLRVLLGHQGLRVVWLQPGEGQQVQALLQDVHAAAKQVKEQSGDGSAVAGVEQLQTALDMLVQKHV